MKILFGLGTINDGSICWFSRKFYDVHDYPLDKGGNGHPWHFYKYECPNCGAKFGI